MDATGNDHPRFTNTDEKDRCGAYVRAPHHI
jgi:hypothetical protein